jgi:hypothetical protein
MSGRFFRALAVGALVVASELERNIDRAMQVTHDGVLFLGLAATLAIHTHERHVLPDVAVLTHALEGRLVPWGRVHKTHLTRYRTGRWSCACRWLGLDDELVLLDAPVMRAQHSVCDAHARLVFVRDAKLRAVELVFPVRRALTTLWLLALFDQNTRHAGVLVLSTI